MAGVAYAALSRPFAGDLGVRDRRTGWGWFLATCEIVRRGGRPDRTEDDRPETIGVGNDADANADGVICYKVLDRKDGKTNIVVYTDNHNEGEPLD